MNNNNDDVLFLKRGLQIQLSCMSLQCNMHVNAAGSLRSRLWVAVMRNFVEY